MKDPRRTLHFAQQVANCILDSPRFRQMLREMVLMTLVEQEEQRGMGAARAFVSACQAKGISVWVGKDGRLKGRNVDRMGADLRAVLTVYREEIVRHLERVRDIEQQARQRAEQPKPAAPAPTGRPDLKVRSPS